jgi:hypothetical protein
MIKDISEVIPEKNIVILSPHYDDVPLTFGGYFDALAKNRLLPGKNIKIINIFSRSNYQARDDVGNRDQSMERLQFATGIRVIEDLNCLDELIGKGNYSYEIKAERECVIRQKTWKPGETFEFPQGTKDDFDNEDQQIYDRIRNYAEAWLQEEEGTALLLPLAIKEHIDHTILREALVDTVYELGRKATASIYFGEDEPYAGLAFKKDWTKADIFIKKHSLVSLDYLIDENRKVDLVMKFYPTQVEESYRTGILNRSNQLKKQYKIDNGMERIYRWDK